MLFADLAATSAAVAATSGRKAKVDLLAQALRKLAERGDPAEIAAGSAYLSGELRQRQIGLGYAGLRDLPPPAQLPTHSVLDVDSAFSAIGAVSGQGSQARRRALVLTFFAAATADEQRMLAALVGGELRQGAQAGLLADAIAAAAAVPPASIRRALLLAGDLKTVAVAALIGGEPALAEFTLSVGRPVAPMLAQSAADIDAAIAATGLPAAVDAKLDGVRIQVHRSGPQVAIFSRSLDELTGRMPEIVTAVQQLPARSLVLDGEALAVDDSGRPLPFQETASRGMRRESGSLKAFFFDLLHVDGADLIDEPGARRWPALDAAVPESMRVSRVVVDDAEQAAAAYKAALAAGQEGVVVKSAQATYDVGRRGSGWVKVKPRHTLDLVILAAEWGHGRRSGWLSNLHLGARDPAGGFVMLGKTFKGLTDQMLAWQTERLQELVTERGDWVVKVRPELVVEIAFDGVQRSTRYPSGVTLRFARVLRYREDKHAAEADTVDAVRSLLL
ncbi:MAG TPA: ATP-dependent DNA ligase [Micromonosporaceae bacterium]|nr:ATP-dependent DNA ligase [Micromonosporaceae bacterium]